MGERVGVKGRRGEGKEKVEGMTEERGGRDGELGWEICATAAGGWRQWTHDTCLAAIFQQWRKSVVKYGDQGQSSRQTVSDASKH